MKDQFDREIEYARFSVTDRYNLRCRYCMPECGVKKIRLTGGEPLLRKNLPALIRELKNLSGIEQVTLTTNGVLLKTFAWELIAARLDGINLSLDTLDEKIFTDLTRRNFLRKCLRVFKPCLPKI